METFVYMVTAGAIAAVGVFCGYYLGQYRAVHKHVIPLMNSTWRALSDNNRALGMVADRLDDLEIVNPEDLLDDDDDDEEDDGVNGTGLFFPNLIVRQYDQGGTLINTEVTIHPKP